MYLSKTKAKLKSRGGQKVFQNITKDLSDEAQKVYEEQKRKSMKEMLKNLFNIQNLILYTISFLISMVGFSSENLMLSLSPFAISFLAAMLSNYSPIGIVYLLTLIGTWMKFGPSNVLTYFLTTLVFFAFTLLKRPKIEEMVNEQKRLGFRLFLSVLIVQVVPMFFTSFYIYDLLTSIMLAISCFVFYKIFANSIPIIKELGRKTVFSVEEVMGTSLLLAIAICVFGDLTIFGFSIKNILSILIVLVLGWKNGMLIGATSGVMIGVTLGIISGSEPILVASYAISGMIAGLFNKLGKIGVVIGFILGNIGLTYVANGNTVPVILIQEILIAFLGLLAVPKRVKIDIADFMGKEKLLPETTLASRTLTENEDTIFKLNNMSEAIQDMAKSYQEAASTLVSEEDLKQQEKSNEQIFIEELRMNLQELEDNMLCEEIEENQDGIVDDIFHYLLKEEIITEKKLVDILEQHNNYLVGFYEKNEQVIEDVSKMIKAINSAYRMSKLNFIWKKKMQEDKKNVATGLEGVSQAISNLASEMKEEQEDPFADKKQEIQTLLKEKEIEVEAIKIKQFSSGRYQVEIYNKLCDEIEGTKCNIKKIGRILNKVLKDKFLIQAQECGLRENKTGCKFTYLSDDKYSVQIGVATSIKEGSPVSGDSHTETKLEDGKYLIAISDGMGSGPEAMKSSKIAIKMLERLFKAGFDKETSINLINSTLAATSKEDMYATLDIQILDLYGGNMEFMKSGACPTYVKRNKEVQILKAITLPAGILDKSDLIVYDYDLQEGDIIIMCSDGIVDANSDYLNKELWVKYLLEDIQTEDSQKIANLILEEAIDNDFGRQKDDMTVTVAKISKNKKSEK